MMTREQLDAIKKRLAALEVRVAAAEAREAERLAIVRHMVKHRTQAYLRKKLGAS